MNDLKIKPPALPVAGKPISSPTCSSASLLRDGRHLNAIELHDPIGLARVSRDLEDVLTPFDGNRFCHSLDIPFSRQD